MQHEKKGSVRDVLMKPEDIHACFNTQLEIISRLEKTNTKMTELNTASEQKYKRVQKSFSNAAEMLKKMQADLWFIHSAVKKLTQLSSSEQAAVDKTTAIVQSKTGDVQIEENKDKASEEHKSEDKAAKGTDNQGENVKAAAEDVKASEGQNVAAENKTEQEAVKEEGAQEKAE